MRSTRLLTAERSSILQNDFVHRHLRVQSTRKHFAFVLLLWYGRNSVTAASLTFFIQTWLKGMNIWQNRTSSSSTDVKEMMWFKQKLTSELQQNHKQIEFYLVKQHINLHCREIPAMIKQKKEHRDHHSSRLYLNRWKQQQRRAKTYWHKSQGRLLDPNTWDRRRS